MPLIYPVTISITLYSSSPHSFPWRNGNFNATWNYISLQCHIAWIQISFTWFRMVRKARQSSDDFDIGVTVDDNDDDDSDYDGRPESLDDKVRKKEMRKGIDLATTLERIEKNFVITDPRLPDNPIVRLLVSKPDHASFIFIFKLINWYNCPLCLNFQIFASDSFLELTEYSREEILGRNCRWESRFHSLQGWSWKLALFDWKFCYRLKFKELKKSH